jgi:tryptophanyl-tRNA synthetase
MRKIITGIKSTGSSLHLGNLMGAVLPFARVAKGNDAAIFIADLHSITSVKDGQTLRDQTLEIAIEYFAIYGLDTPFTIFRQSDIRQITELMWILTNVTPYSLMLRAHSFKDAEQKLKEFKEKEGEIIDNKLEEGVALFRYDSYLENLRKSHPDITIEELKSRDE